MADRLGLHHLVDHVVLDVDLFVLLEPDHVKVLEVVRVGLVEEVLSLDQILLVFLLFLGARVLLLFSKS